MSTSPSPEYCIVIPVQPMQVGVWIDHSRWPRHLTVVPNFRIGTLDIDVMTAVLRKVSARMPLPVATVAEEALFGPQGATSVQLVESDDLHRVHLMLMDAMEAAGTIESIAPGYNRSGYRPHLTVVDGGLLERDFPLALDTLLLVEIAPEHHRSMAVPVAVARIGQSVTETPVSSERAASVCSILRGHGIRFWVVGGWGVDALIGRKSRDHHDVDLFVLNEDVGALLELLRTSGSGVSFLWSESRWFDGLPSAFVADLAGTEIDVHVIDFAGELVRILSEPWLELPAGALRGSGRIAGLPVECATPSAQLLLHRGYELPEKQLGDVEILTGLDARGGR